jgi:hypothetical protein
MPSLPLLCEERGIFTFTFTFACAEEEEEEEDALGPRISPFFCSETWLYANGFLVWTAVAELYSTSDDLDAGRVRLGEIYGEAASRLLRRGTGAVAAALRSMPCCTLAKDCEARSLFTSWLPFPLPLPLPLPLSLSSFWSFGLNREVEKEEKAEEEEEEEEERESRDLAGLLGSPPTMRTPDEGLLSGSGPSIGSRLCCLENTEAARGSFSSTGESPMLTRRRLRPERCSSGTGLTVLPALRPVALLRRVSSLFEPFDFFLDFTLLPLIYLLPMETGASVHPFIY